MSVDNKDTTVDISGFFPTKDFNKLCLIKLLTHIMLITSVGFNTLLGINLIF